MQKYQKKQPSKTFEITTDFAEESLANESLQTFNSEGSNFKSCFGTQTEIKKKALFQNKLKNPHL